MMSTVNESSASRRPRNRESDGAGVDRISTLPKSILIHILCFLPILYAVKTSVLSRRWRFLWTGVHCLDFGAKLVRKLGGREKTENFISRLLLQNKAAHIQRFNVESVLNKSPDMLELWIKWAINRKVEVLGLSFANHSPLMHHLPTTIFGCTSLVALRLKNHYVSVAFPPSACIPCLKTLELESLSSPDNDLENKLIACCVALENLYIRREGFVNINSYRIHLQQLKRLAMRIYQAQEYDEECVVDVNAPNLEVLDIEDDGVHSLLLENVGKLRKATINVNSSKAFNSLLECFSALTNVKSLHLSSSHIKQACTLEPGLAVQNVNLTHLTLEARSLWVQLLPYFFQCFPNLQVLILAKDSSVCKYSGGFCADPKLLPGGLVSHLEVFAVEEFWGTSDELGMVEYVLESGEVLEVVRLSYPRQSWSTIREMEERLRVAQKILSFRRASKKCRIQLENVCSAE